MLHAGAGRVISYVVQGHGRGLSVGGQNYRPNWTTAKTEQVETLIKWRREVMVALFSKNAVKYAQNGY